MSSDVLWEEESPMSSCCVENEQRNPPKCCTITQIPVKYLEKYRRFLQRNRFVLSLIEDGLGRLVLYAPSRFIYQSEEDFYDDNSKVLPETLYAFINIWSLLNDAIYHGFGRGNGLTVGSLDRPVDGFCHKKIETRAKVIMLLRTILSMIECMAPSLEVSAYSRHGRRRSNSQSLGTSQAHHRHLNALTMSSKIEKIKFICRMALFALNYSEQIKSFTLQKDNAMNVLSNMGVLQEGGLLEPNEHLTFSRDENERVKKLLYVGKRTGRQIRYNVNQVQNVMPLTAAATPTTKIGMLILGELMHVYRPLYYVQSSLRNESVGGNKGRHGMVKSWIVSLVMDLLSQRLIIAGKTVRKGGSECVVDISSESTKEEMYRRKMRLAMYLLRSPVWNMATYPIAEKISRVIAHVPLVGKPLVHYLMDVLNYWQRWHFMQEG